jgi:4-hydroxybenzoate polyprenyltransferase
MAAGIALGVISLGIALVTNRTAFYILSAYLGNTLLYSLYFKKRVLLDVLSISSGFMLRFIGGALIIGIDTSKWFLVCTFSLSLFLAFGKRRAEIEILTGYTDPAAIRKTFGMYTKENLDTALAVTNTLCILSYLLFVTDLETIQRHHSNWFIYTVPVAVYCLFRYMYKVQEGRGPGPVEIIYEDRFLLGAILLWILMVLIILSCSYG